ncbi:hypothetical protein EKI60_03010 [Candidatus Saccharibacteria bacterium]|nr:MAG: hypothetical protein EKI60_03010 [Candidatus Saccharibacteria bacterium]
MDIFTLTLGLVAPQDHIALAAGIEVRGQTLIDHANGARHQMEARAANAVDRINKSFSAGHWFKQAATCGLRRAEAAEILRFLAGIAGLKIRHRQRFLRFRLLRLRLAGGQVLRPAIRKTGDERGLFKALSMAFAPVCIATIIVCVLAYGGNLLSPTFVLAHVGLLLTVFVSTAVHEWVHLHIARSQVSGVCIVVRGTRLGVLHRQLMARHEWQSAVYGPLAGSIVALLLMAVVAIFSRSVFVLASIGMVAVFHWLSWIPQYGDGQTVRRLWRLRHETAS